MNKDTVLTLDISYIVLSFALIALKITEVIDWSWWIVLAPILLPVSIFAILNIFILLIMIIYFFIYRK